MSYLKQAITGTNDYHATMQTALVEGLRVQGGYVPPVCAESECRVPRMVYVDTINWFACNSERRIGDMTFIRIDIRACTECCDKLDTYHETIIVYSALWDNEICEICGRVHSWEIPF